MFKKETIHSHTVLFKNRFKGRPRQDARRQLENDDNITQDQPAEIGNKLNKVQCGYSVLNRPSICIKDAAFRAPAAAKPSVEMRNNVQVGQDRSAKMQVSLYGAGVHRKCVLCENIGRRIQVYNNVCIHYQMGKSHK